MLRDLIQLIKALIADLSKRDSYYIYTPPRALGSKIRRFRND